MFEYLREEAALIRRGRTAGDRLTVAAMSARLHLAALGVPLPGAEREIELRLEPDLDLRVRASDSILFEVIGFGSYDFDLAPAGPIAAVLDAGANIGLATIALARRLPDTRFVCVEPVSGSFALLERNLSVNVPTAVAIQAAVTARPGAVTIHPGRNSMTHRAVLAQAPVDDAVPGLTIPQLLDQAGLERADLLKLDIEGGEAELLEDLDGWIDRVGSIIAEIHAPLVADAVAATLGRHGLERVPLPALPRFRDLIFAARR